VALERLLEEIAACRVCAPHLPHGCRPVVRIGPAPRILIKSQAPGRRVHESGLPFDDPSGDRLRFWLGVDRAAFYDTAAFGFAPMAFCFPGNDARGGDRPPRPECAPLWRERLTGAIRPPLLTVHVGGYALFHDRPDLKPLGLTEAVRGWRNHAPTAFPLPHPSWRNTAWLKANPWFEAELLPALRAAVGLVLDAGAPRS
jgi:uracil-DNA glycosylase